MLSLHRPGLQACSPGMVWKALQLLPEAQRARVCGRLGLPEAQLIFNKGPWVSPAPSDPSRDT